MVTLPSVSRGHHQSMEVTPPWLIHYPTINSENGFLTMTLIHKWTHIHVSTKITFNPLLSAGKHGFLDNDLYLIHVSSRSTLIRYVTSAGCYFLCISRKVIYTAPWFLLVDLPCSYYAISCRTPFYTVKFS